MNEKKLPLQASRGWLERQSKLRLVEMRQANPAAGLGDARGSLARDYGFLDWRQLKSQVDKIESALASASPSMRMPVDQGARVTSDDPDLIALFRFVADGDLPSLLALMGDRGELVSCKRGDGATPLHMAAQFNDPKMCLALLSLRADPDANFGQSSHTPLSWAVTCNANQCAKALVAAGCVADLFCAAGIGSLEGVQACFDESGRLRPHAAKFGSSRMTACGDRLPVPPESDQDCISDALYIASRNAHANVAGYLLDRGADVSFRAFLGATALHWACFSGSRELIQQLLEAGADTESTDDELRCRPREFGVCIAAKWGLDFKLRQLLTSNPELVNPDHCPTTPLLEAVNARDPEIVRFLMEANADPDLANTRGISPVMLAGQKQYHELLPLLRK